ncbi:MAG: NUDIX domain-containing protein [Albimonas sp.]|uniref:NUDIX domain-containing protein n=1 Tax=Albimonas sp. TaxID=1872425 RepID=UPI004056D9E8|tara:strand:- start:161 stop:631 length:471 start_codon:yes stop_codon:yes gene_type:complete
MRRFGDPWRSDAPYRERPGAYGAILGSGPRAGQMLLAATPNDGEAFLLPGGGVDPGESPLRALTREVYEETGYSVQPLRRLGAFQQYRWMPDYQMWARKICHIYLCRAGRPLGPPVEPDHTPVWLPVAEAVRRLSVAGERHVVSRHLAARARRSAA